MSDEVAVVKILRSTEVEICVWGEGEVKYHYESCIINASIISLVKIFMVGGHYLKIIETPGTMLRSIHFENYWGGRMLLQLYNAGTERTEKREVGKKYLKLSE